MPIDTCDKHESCLVVFGTERETCPICEKIAGLRIRLDLKEYERHALQVEYTQYKWQMKREQDKINRRRTKKC